MKTRYGSSVKDWERAKEEMRGVLVETARRKEFISYSDLVARVHTIRLDPHSHALAAMLGEISTEEHNRGRGMLSALVLSKDEGKPGTGFFALAEELKLDISEPDRFWIAEVNRVHADWAGA